MPGFRARSPVVVPAAEIAETLREMTSRVEASFILDQLQYLKKGGRCSAVAVLGMVAGAAFCHNFGLASSADGPTGAGKVAVILGLAAAAAIGGLNLRRSK